jgi:N4-gp56 family major capsid protein
MPITVTDPGFFFPVLSAKLLYAPRPDYIMDQFAMKEINIRFQQGDTVTLNRYPYLGDVGLTEALRTPSESANIGIANPINLTYNAVPLTLTEFFGPYSAGSSSIQPLGISEKVAKYASQKLADYGDPTSFVNDAVSGDYLSDDHARFHDRALINRALATSNFQNPAGKADGSTLITDKFTVADLGAIRETLQVNLAPKFMGKYYIAVIGSRTEKHLRQDTDFKNAMNYNQLVQERALDGSIGAFEGFLFYRSENIPTATVNALTARQSLFFGMGAFGYAEGEKREIRINKNDDFGRFLYLIWRAVRAYATINTAFIVKGRTFAT